jgi:serine protease DegS
MNQVARIKPTDKVAIQVMRNGKELKLHRRSGPATAARPGERAGIKDDP